MDGVSLTVSALSPPGIAGDEQWFEVCLIPETLKRTTLGTRAPGDTVNLEVDVIAKHVERLSAGGRQVTQILDDVDRAIKDIAAGRPVLVVDDEDRENEGDIIFAAGKATPELLAFMIRYTSGVICVPMRGAELDRLQLPQMTSHNTEHMRTAFTVSVDARDGVTHRHLGRRPRPHDPRARRLRDRAAPNWCAPATSSRSATPRAACCAAPGTPRPRSTWPGWPGCRRRACCAEVVNDDGTMARLPELRTLRQRARPGADLDRAARSSTAAAPSADGPAGRRDADPERLRQVAAFGYRQRHRRHRAHRARARRPQRRQGDAGPGCTPSA